LAIALNEKGRYYPRRSVNGRERRGFPDDIIQGRLTRTGTRGRAE